jgi:hypothetical protein
MRVDVQQDKDSDIYIMQDSERGTDLVLLTPEQASALGYRLLSFANGQGPRETEAIDDRGNVKLLSGEIVRSAS